LRNAVTTKGSEKNNTWGGKERKDSQPQQPGATEGGKRETVPTRRGQQNWTTIDIQRNKGGERKSQGQNQARQRKKKKRNN